MTIMTRDNPEPPTIGTETAQERLRAAAIAQLRDASRTAHVERRRRAVANAASVGLTMALAGRLLGVARATVDADLQAAKDAGIPASPIAALAAVETLASGPPILYTCHVCREPIAQGTGYVSCPYSEINAVRAHAEDESRSGGVSLREALDRAPDRPRARWRARHLECSLSVVEDLIDGYELEVEQIDDPAKLLAWQNHLWGKTWFPLTEWDAFIADQVLPSILRQGSSAAGR